LNYLSAMKFALADPADGYAINAYGDDGVVINGRRFDRSLVLMPRQIIEGWQPKSFEELVTSHFRQLAELAPDLVLLGTGRRQQFPSPHLYQALISSGIGLEVMSTAAACRTYNILMSEGRTVAAALLLG
jgi:uncharacterized protein